MFLSGKKEKNDDVKIFKSLRSIFYIYKKEVEKGKYFVFRQKIYCQMGSILKKEELQIAWKKV